MTVDGTTEFLLKDLTFQILAAVFEVHNVLGPGFLEIIYLNALLNELKIRGIPAEAQKAVKVHYKGNVVGDYFADILVDNVLILELKAVECFHNRHSAQLLNYLKATGLRVGLLINFANERVEYKRLVL